MSESHTPVSPTPTPSAGPQRSFPERVWGALKLDAGVYDEVEHDPSAMGQAVAVVALAAVAQGLAAFGAGGVAGLVGNVFAGVLGWLLGAGIIWLIGVKVFEHASDYPELLRTLGFASAPKLLLAVGILPLGFLWVLVSLVVFVLTLLAWVVAVRQALDVSTGRAVWVCLLAVGVTFLLGLLLGGLGALG